MPNDRPCEHLWDALSAYVDGELTPAEALEVELHAAACPGCARAIDFMAGLSGSVGRAEEALPPADLRERILAATVARPHLTDPLSDLFRRLQTPSRAWALCGAAVAGLALTWITTATLPGALLGPLRPGPQARTPAPSVAAVPPVPVVPPRQAAGAPESRPSAAAADLHSLPARPQHASAHSPRGRTAAPRPAPRLADAAGPRSVAHVRPTPVPERSLAPGLPAPAPPPVVETAPRQDPAPVPVPSAAPSVADSDPAGSGEYVLTAAAPSTGAHVATMAGLRETLRRPGHAARPIDLGSPQDRELTVTLVQSRF